MKKLLFVLLSCIFAFSCVFALGCSCQASCNCSNDYTEPCKDGEHVYGDWVYQNDATCLKDGTEVRSCENPYCMSKESRTVSGTRVLQHKIVHVEEKQAYCLEDGVLAHFECSICQTAFSDQAGQNVIADKSILSIPKTEHEYEETWTVDKAATGHTDGSESRHCVNFEKCGAKTDEQVIPKWDDDPNGWSPNA